MGSEGFLASAWVEVPGAHAQAHLGDYIVGWQGREHRNDSFEGAVVGAGVALLAMEACAFAVVL
jgi:hypothetical protein